MVIDVIPSNLNKTDDEITKHFTLFIFKLTLHLFTTHGLFFIQEVETVFPLRNISVKNLKYS